jgi:lysophospholipase L1-like esterase
MERLIGMNSLVPRISLVAAVLLSLPVMLVLTGCTAWNSSKIPGTEIVVVGDSYTTGPNENPEDPHVWPAMTWRDLRAHGYEIAPVVVGEGGAGYAHPGHLGSVFADKAKAIGQGAELIVFFGSANDMTVPPAELQRAVRETLTKARVTAAKAHLLIIGPAWPRPDVRKEVWEVRDIVRSEAAELGATFVDPLEQRWLWDDPTLIGPDGIHPNHAGQRYLSEKIRPLLEAELPKPQP